MVRQGQSLLSANGTLNCDQIFPKSYSAWCATGNLFSAQTEHETAIKFFQRAIQVDPNFPYAYTLLGHEYVLTEELDKAITAFRNAIRLDPRHYNAWFGLGTIFSKQEQYSLAELHFKRALQINPQNSALMCHIGVVQHALKKTDQALKTLNTALMNDPYNILCKSHRASINFSIGRHMEVHKKLGNTHLALMYFSWATDLDPKGVNSQIKEAILSLGQGDDDSPPTQYNEQQAQSNSMDQDVETSSREGSAVPLAGNVSIEPHADDSDDSL
ncbi:Cell division cycle protein 27 like protein [Cyphomyrmex costatus]|uniref:Cell division cycle protein 27 homolog n=1 Tax=Cyphomyrmex costatus TaxID=456900 RepID=A0A195D293_9HYME|nr:Cell division cycle protein 27 like protein [Cyphomyrmex costatus]